MGQGSCLFGAAKQIVNKDKVTSPTQLDNIAEQTHDSGVKKATQSIVTVTVSEIPPTPRGKEEDKTNLSRPPPNVD